jgi:hypothetical protein
MAASAHDLPWTRRLVNTLLDELHVTDEFDRLVGPVSRVPVSQADCGNGSRRGC